jgi:hypothetical protein
MTWATPLFLLCASGPPRDAISISSQNRSIMTTPLLKEVPPLKAKYVAYFEVNNNLKTSVTHQSFSIALEFIPEFNEA